MKEVTGIKIIQFREPIKVGDVIFETITLREPLAGELRDASRQDTSVGVALYLIHRIGKIPMKAVDQIPQTELEECSDFLGSFGRPQSRTTPVDGSEDAEQQQS